METAINSATAVIMPALAVDVSGWKTRLMIRANVASTDCQLGVNVFIPAAPPMPLATSREAMSTTVTSSTATTEPAISAAQTSMVWL